ncbi:MAG: hypothetical protein LBS84_07570 [Clostridiales bacterium]|jgi:hypothetical protein|nr:hypothetical protein [Clostridiales bacterium]
MKKRVFLWAALGVLAAVPLFTLFDSQSEGFTRSGAASATTVKPFVRSTEAVDFTGLTFNGWDYTVAAEKVQPRAKKPYTLMIFMNGSDLESENGAATSDLTEILQSGVNTENVNIVLFTGGASRWQNDVVPDNECMIWEISGGKLNSITGVGLLNMGDPGTLADFINLGYSAFPAERYALIMWDHGGGAIAGYGQDEKFDNSNLTLLDMNYAFAKSETANKKLELLGFDSCLMATAEMAMVSSDYAEYLIASEDLEPGNGWDYGFLSAFNGNSGMDGSELGQTIADQFMYCYSGNTDEILTISITDLSRAGHVMSAMGALMSKCGDKLDDSSSFHTLAKRRGTTKTFGEGSPRDNQCDMVDLGDMARKLSDMYPDESQSLLAELDAAVIYNRNNSDVNLGGLSAYYIYGGRDIGGLTLQTYDSLCMDGSYTDYLNGFFTALTAGNTVTRSSFAAPSDDTPVDLTAWRAISEKPGHFMLTGVQADDYPNGLWPKIDGEYVSLFPIVNNGRRTLYAAPAVMNGRECNLIILISARNPNGKILGVRQNDGLVIQKGFDEIKPEDKLQLYYKEYNFTDKTEAWTAGAVIDAAGGLKLEWDRLTEDMYISTQFTDDYGNLSYSQPVKAY